MAASTAKEKTLSVEETIAQINKDFGPNSIGTLTSADIVPVEVISTGVLPLDLALGTGGLPRGRIVEMFGPQSSGKTTIALQTVAQAQKQGLLCAYVDVEHALDPTYMSALGVEVEKLLLSQPNTAEEALEIVIRLAKTKGVAVIVVDSVAALVPRAELEGEVGDAHVGLQPRLIGQSMRKMVGTVYDSNTMVIFINQLRESIGKMYGPSEYTPGGKSIPYYASVRLDIRRIQTVKTGEVATANRTRVKVVKNKVGIPYRQCEFDLVYGLGVPASYVLLDMGVESKVLKKNGGWYYFDGVSLGNGKPAAAKTLDEDSKLFAEVEAAVIEKVGIPPIPEVEEDFDSDI